MGRLKIEGSLLLFAMTFMPSSVAEAQLNWSWEDFHLGMRLQSVAVTDRAGATSHLVSMPGGAGDGISPHFTYNPANWSDDRVWGEQKRDQFEVVGSNAAPKRSVWVHYSQIKTLVFEQQGPALRVRLTLDNGDEVRGEASADLVGFIGKGSLGDVTYKKSDIRRIEFLAFSRKDGRPVAREAFAPVWRAKHKEIALACGPDPNRWTG